MLSLTGISKHFGSVTALGGVDFSLRRGEVHALLGENGAGKSTLMHVAYGMVAPDGGTIRVNGSAAAIRSPRDARRLGIGMVHQHFTSIEALTVRENLELARGGRPVGRLGGSGAGRTGRLGEGLDPDVRVRDLSVALRQRLEIAQALAPGATMLLLDEPSAVLAPGEVEELLGQIRRFGAAGGAVALITHKLDEVFAVADRVTVLRQGAVTLHGPVPQQSVARLAEAMLGEGLGPVGRRPREAAVPRAGPILVRIDGIDLRGGELIGIAAIEGHGHRGLLRRIAGVGDPGGWGGRVAVQGTTGFVAEDRTTEGLIPEMTLAENLLLGQEGDARWQRNGWLRWGAVKAHAGAMMGRFRIGGAGPDAPAATLSGGNQQKVMLARALERSPAPQVLVAENPTRGLDIRATQEIQDRLREAARAGMAVVMYSSDLDEVLNLADRVLVVREGRVTEAPAGADRQQVGKMMLGVRSEE